MELIVIPYKKLYFKKMRRKFLKLFSLSMFSFLFLPYKYLYSATKKIINQNLTEEQKKYFFTKVRRSLLLAYYYMKRDLVFITVLIARLNYLALIQNMTVVLGGHHFLKLFQEHLKPKLTTHLG